MICISRAILEIRISHSGVRIAASMQVFDLAVLCISNARDYIIINVEGLVRQ